MAVNRNKRSEHGQGLGEATDVLALSPQARMRRIVFDLPATTQSTTTYATVQSVGYTSTPLGGYVVFRTIPVVAGGTCTLTVTYTAADGTTETVLTTTQTLLSKTNLVPFALTLDSAVAPATATSYLDMAAAGSITVKIVTSNDVVGTAQVGGTLVLLVDPVEDSPISDPNKTVRGT